MSVAQAYLPILLFMGLAAIIAGAMVVIAAVFSPSKPDSEKASTYECGFEAFDDARSNSMSAFIWWRFCSSFLT